MANNFKITHWQLKQRQSLPLRVKVQLSLNRISDFYEYFEGQVYVAFSGGKDSTVLLHLVRSLYPEVPAVFCNTGVEFPEVCKFVKSINNVVWLKPKKTFKEIIMNYGYPIISKEIAKIIWELRNCNLTEKTKHKWLERLGKWCFLLDAPYKISSICCKFFKKDIVEDYKKETNRKPFVALLAEESFLRMKSYLMNSCNSYHSKQNSRSMPLAFWTTKDIWQYIRENNLSYSTIYDMGYERTGCIYCGFGIHLEKIPNRFQLLRTTHPKLYNYCMDRLGLKSVYNYLKIEV